MAVTNLAVDGVYLGDGITTSFAIPFDFKKQTQVRVKETNLTTNVTTILTQGVQYSITGTSPGTNVVYTVAPNANTQVTVYRATVKEQAYSFISTGVFKQEDLETALDYICMMVQEIEDGIVASTVPGGGALARLAAQSLAAAETITVSTDQRIIKNVQGNLAAVAAVIADGEIDGQEICLVGLHDIYTVTLDPGANLHLNGSITLKQYSNLGLIWDGTNSIWIETRRSE